MTTMIAGAPYDPTAVSKVWDDFLDQATGQDEGLKMFLQKAVGYSLTGDNREEVMFFLYGPTATGKSTFLESVKTALGDYAATVDVEAFLQKRFSSGGPSPELAKLRGKRMVVSIEVDEGKQLAEGLIKMITGGDDISVRGLYKDPETFKPTFKIWIAANNRPKVSDVDDAIWRRIIVLPFTHQVPPKQRDKTLKLRLTTTELPAILAWAVRGCIMWQRDGLGSPPASVEGAIQEYKEDVDPIGPWFEDNVELAPGKYTPQADLYSSYALFAKAAGQRFVFNAVQFGLRLTARGFPPDKVGDIRVRKGIVLKGERREQGY